MTSGYALFDTSLGACVLAWTERGVSALLWPESNAETARRRAASRFDQLSAIEPPDNVRQAIDGVQALLHGEAADFAAVVLDLRATTAFEQSVYAIARTIPAGATLTYGEIARRLGDRLLARDVGQALGRNPIPIIVPCHRVLAAGRKTGGFSAPGGVASKLRLLAIEGAEFGGQPGLFKGL